MANSPRENSDAILITGPTASGKSALALQLAERHNGVIINADSMQVYDTLSVLTARPGADDLARAEHRLYGHVAVIRTYSTGQWLRDIAREIADLQQKGQMPIIVGGTGLYFMALTGGLSDLPDIPDLIRNRLRNEADIMGGSELHARLVKVDPESAARIKPNDIQRIVRALEVFEASGSPLSQLARNGGKAIIAPERAEKIVVLPDRALLHARISQRFKTMMEGDAVSEVRAFLSQNPAPDLPAMKAIGVRQIADMLENKITVDDAIELASAATRQYAKRQMTWFRNQMDESWQRVDPYRD